MSGLFRRDADDWIDIDFTDWSHSQRDTFLFLKQAILDKHVLLFEYHSAMGETSRRVVEPQRLWFKHRAWYLRGYCRLRGDMRLFRVSRMRHIVTTNEDFPENHPEADPVEEYHAHDRPVIKLRFRIDKAQSYRVYDEFEDDMFTRDENGNFLVTAHYPEDEWVYGFLMSFGPYLEVLEPVHIQTILADRLRKTLNYYAPEGQWEAGKIRQNLL
jgi:predicted DNA-binding transcriptional regulator YafY